MGERVIEAKFNVHENYNKVKIKNPYRYVSGGGGFDADAQAFINATGITDSTQQSAINTLVIGLKADSLWAKMKAIYPFVGGTADTHKYNLKDPRDLDAAFRLTFAGTPIHSSTGVNCQSFNVSAQTYINVLNDLNDYSHINVYVRNLLNTGNNMDVDTDNTSNREFYLGITYGVFNWISNVNNSGLLGYTPSGSGGMFVSNRQNSTQVEKYQDGVIKQTLSATLKTRLNNNVWLFRGAPGEYSAKEYAFVTLGDGMTATDNANLYTLVQAYQTTLSRQV